MKGILVTLVSVAMLTLAGCKSVPEKPSFVPSKAFDGKYQGTRIDVSKDEICKETSMTGSVKDGKAQFSLTYNSTSLQGWIAQDGQLELYDDNPQWDYQFIGKATDGVIKGTWRVGNAPCRGTWSVDRI